MEGKTRQHVEHVNCFLKEQCLQTVTGQVHIRWYSIQHMGRRKLPFYVQLLHMLKNVLKFNCLFKLNNLFINLYISSVGKAQ